VTTATFTLTSELPGSEIGLRCFDGGGVETCDLAFSNAAFDIYGANIGDDVADQIAENYFENIQLRAVKDDAGVCVPLLEGSQNVTFTHSCSDPGGSCKTALEYNDIDLNPSASVTLNFDDQGVADLGLFQYADAGIIGIAATATITDDDGDTVIESGNESVTVIPANLDITLTDSTENYDAGADFSLTIRALGSSGTVLKNYQPGQLQFVLTSANGLASGDLQYSASGAIASSASTSFRDVEDLPFTEGVYTYTSANFSEVDSLTFNVQDADYSDNIISNTQGSQTLGLFIPAYFEVTANAFGFDSFCSTSSPFSYFGQNFGFATDPSFTITAYNANGITTSNYRDASWDWLLTAAQPSATSFSDPNFSGGISIYEEGTATSENVESSGIEYGKRLLTLQDMQLIYAKQVSEISPLTASASMLLPASMFTDTSYTGNSICLVNNYDKSSPGACEDLTVDNITGTELRWGRIALDNAFGPENENLLASVRTEYFDGSNFIRNRDDQCTATSQWIELTFNVTNDADVSYADISDEVNVSADFGLIDGLSQGIEGITITAVTDDDGNYLKGQVIIELLPVSDSTISWDDFLQYDWNGTEDGFANPYSTITFGQFRGNDRIIHWREVF
jgi:MSHA biogenesis protein MshQ